MLHFEASAEEAVRCGVVAVATLRCRAELRPRFAQDMFDAQITNICLGVQSIIEKMEAQGIQLAAS